jgi:hypothetical protein
MRTSPLLHAPTGRQRFIRRHSRGLSLKKAVRFSVDALFEFNWRATQGKALWCETERVWLGSNTFLDWAIWDADIDIPWVVATAAGAPKDALRLREAVREELVAYWVDRLNALPPKGRPHWLPLP